MSDGFLAMSDGLKAMRDGFFGLGEVIKAMTDGFFMLKELVRDVREPAGLCRRAAVQRCSCTVVPSDHGRGPDLRVRARKGHEIGCVLTQPGCADA